MQKKLSILMATAECSPFVKVGGIGDVLGSLPQAIAQNGVAVSVIMPLYGSIDRKKFKLKKLATIVKVKRNQKIERVSVFIARLPRNPITYYFLEHPYFAGKAIYTHKRRFSLPHEAYTRSASDVARFSWFSEAVVETANQLKLNPDIIHCHDWHAAFIPTFADQFAITKFYPFTKTVLTVHNLANQGVTLRDFIKRLSIPIDMTPSVMEDYYDLDAEQLNSMKLGILSVDAITFVSENYAKEVLTPEYGAGLENYLKRRSKNIYGILNGIDLGFFNPARDSFIFKKYSVTNLKQNKPINKTRLQKQLGLPVTDAPLYSMVTRIVHQKGFDILAQALPSMLTKNVQVVILGTGDKELEQQILKIAQKYKNKVRFVNTFDAALAQKIYAGSDFFLMPSKFEPCGLGQMIAMRYGTIPIVRAVGGLKDTVNHMKTGILFADYNSAALTRAINVSLKLYSNKKTWYTMAQRIMREDFSWDKSAKKYIQLYRSML